MLLFITRESKVVVNLIPGKVQVMKSHWRERYRVILKLLNDYVVSCREQSDS